MALLILAVIIILAGTAVRFVGPAWGPRGVGMARLASTILLMVGLTVAVMKTFTVVSVGEVGVQHFLGRVSRQALEQGVHFINPMADVEKMSVREQAFPADGGIEHIEAQTSEQLNVALDISVLYRIDAANAPDLYQRIGSEEQIENRIVLNSIRNGVRDAVATKSINDIFSPNRREIAEEMRQAIQAKAGDRIEVIEVFVREVQAPERVRQAIEEKLQREQNVAAERFQTSIIQERARQKLEEAKGIAEAQRVISEGLTPQYLTFYYIEQLAKLPAGSVVYVPTEGGMPLMRQVGGGSGGTGGNR
jgi:regulator of protease activity HflC (stomatin/prohibitin superfamily)